MISSVENITIIIPSLNPDEKFIKTLDSIFLKGFRHIVVVDDGSDSEHKIPFTYAVEKGCTLLVHEQNKGKGRALKTAFEHCFKNKDCIGVITVDGDGQHGADDIYACGELMLHTNKVVLGCRDFSEPHVPFKSKYGNNITKFAFRALCGIKISDTQTGLRAIPMTYLKDMFEISGERFEYETNMLLEMKTRDIPWVEQKIETIYLDDNASSHFNPFKDSWRIYKIIFKYAFSSGMSAVLDLVLFYLLLSFGTKYELSNPVIYATVLARMASSLFNFYVNKGVVFKSSSNKSIVRYYILCILQTITSALLVNGATSLIPLSSAAATVVKIVVDTLLFFVSFNIQRDWVFREADKEVSKTIKTVKTHYKED